MEDEVTQEEMTAADVMFVEIYGDPAPTYMTTTEAIDRMMTMGRKHP